MAAMNGWHAVQPPETLAIEVGTERLRSRTFQGKGDAVYRWCNQLEKAAQDKGRSWLVSMTCCKSQGK